MSKRSTMRLLYVSTLLSVAVLPLVFATPLFAVNQMTMLGGANAARGDVQPMYLFGATGILTSISNLLLFVVGALSVLMLIFGGLRYATSGGSDAAVTAARNTILYAIVGLVVCFLAYAIVNFVLGSLISGTSATNV